MTSYSVLMVGGEGDSAAAQALFDRGLMVIARKSMREAIEKLRHEDFAAIVVDRGEYRDDVLELVLNVRDFDEKVPVFVLGSSNDEEEGELVRADSNVFIADPESGLESIPEKVEKLSTTGVAE